MPSCDRQRGGQTDGQTYMTMAKERCTAFDKSQHSTNDREK